MTDLLMRDITHAYLPSGWFYRTKASQITATFSPVSVADPRGRLYFSGSFAGTTVRQTLIDTGPIASTWADGDTVTVLTDAFAEQSAVVALRFRKASTGSYDKAIAFESVGSAFYGPLWRRMTLTGDATGGLVQTTDVSSQFDVDIGGSPAPVATYRWIRFRRVSATSLALECAADVGGLSAAPGTFYAVNTLTVDCDWSSVSLCVGIIASNLSGGGLAITQFGYGGSYSAGSAPTITALSTSTAQHRARLTVTGTNFTTLDGFYIGSADYPVEGVSVTSSTSAIITMPPGDWADGSPLIVANRAGTASFGSLSRGSVAPTLTERLNQTFSGTSLPSGWTAVTHNGGTVTVSGGEAVLRTFSDPLASAELRAPLITDLADGDVISVRVRVSTPYQVAVLWRNGDTAGAYHPGWADQSGSWFKASLVRMVEEVDYRWIDAYETQAYGLPSALDGTVEVGATGVYQWLRVRRVDATRLAYEYAEDVSGVPGAWTTIGYAVPRWPRWHNLWRGITWADGLRLCVVVADGYNETDATAIVVRAGTGASSEPDPGPPPSTLTPLAAPTLTAGSPTDTRITRSVPFTVASSGAAWPAGTRVQLQTRRGTAAFRATGRRIATSGRLAFVRELTSYTVDVRAIASALGRADSPASTVVTITVPALTGAPGDTAMPLRCTIALYPSTSAAVTPIGGGAIPVLTARSNSDHVLRITGIILEPALGGGAVVPTSIAYKLEDSTGEIATGTASSPEATDDWRFTLARTLFVPSKLSMLLTVTLTAPDTSKTVLQFIIAQGVRQ